MFLIMFRIVHNYAESGIFLLMLEIVIHDRVNLIQIQSSPITSIVLFWHSRKHFLSDIPIANISKCESFFLTFFRYANTSLFLVNSHYIVIVYMHVYLYVGGIFFRIFLDFGWDFFIRFISIYCFCMPLTHFHLLFFLYIVPLTKFWLFSCTYTSFSP